jgi:hypothetical protein
VRDDWRRMLQSSWAQAFGAVLIICILKLIGVIPGVMWPIGIIITFILAGRLKTLPYRRALFALLTIWFAWLSIPHEGLWNERDGGSLGGWRDAAVFTVMTVVDPLGTSEARLRFRWCKATAAQRAVEEQRQLFQLEGTTASGERALATLERSAERARITERIKAKCREEFWRGNRFLRNYYTVADSLPSEVLGVSLLALGIILLLLIVLFWISPPGLQKPLGWVVGLGGTVAIIMIATSSSGCFRPSAHSVRSDTPVSVAEGIEQTKPDPPYDPPNMAEFEGKLAKAESGKPVATQFHLKADRTITFPISRGKYFELIPAPRQKGSPLISLLDEDGNFLLNTAGKPINRLVAEPRNTVYGADYLVIESPYDRNYTLVVWK